MPDEARPTGGSAPSPTAVPSTPSAPSTPPGAATPQKGLRALDENVVDVQEEGIMRVESQRVATAMRSLTPLQSDAIRLAYFSGYSHSEVAKILDIPLGTAKTRIRDGMIVLRDSLGVTS